MGYAVKQKAIHPQKKKKEQVNELYKQSMYPKL
jgi:hypothetical protein